MGRWLIDGNNVMGSRPDGWWNDRPKAMARLVQEIALWCRSHQDEVVVVFDGRTVADVAILAGGNLSIRFAVRSGRDAADDVLAELAEAGDRLVTADRGLRGRVSADVRLIGPRAFLDTIAG